MEDKLDIDILFVETGRMCLLMYTGQPSLLELSHWRDRHSSTYNIIWNVSWINLLIHVLILFAVLVCFVVIVRGRVVDNLTYKKNYI